MATQRSTAIRYLRLVTRTVVLCLLTNVVFLLSCQSSLIYHPRPYNRAELADIMQHNGRRIEAITSQGRQVAFYLPPAKHPGEPPPYLWLVFAGNGSVALDLSNFPRIWDSRFGYLFIDYPSYGLCEGHPNPDRIKESIVALTEALRKDLHWSEEDFQAHTGVLGHSLGTAAALIAADELKLHSAVLCAPFTTMTDMARTIVGWPLCHLNRHRFDNVARLRELAARKAQVRIFHGCVDQVIPIAMSRRIAQEFPDTVRFQEVPHCDHNEVVLNACEDVGKAMLELSGLPPK